jgi:hypothetical protein
LIELQLRATEDLLENRDDALQIMKMIQMEVLISAIATTLEKQDNSTTLLDKLAGQMPMLQDLKNEEEQVNE